MTNWQTLSCLTFSVYLRWTMTVSIKHYSSRYLLHSGVEQIAETAFGVRRRCVGARQISLAGSKRPARAHQGVAAVLWWSVYHQLESSALSSASGPHSGCEKDSERQHVHSKYTEMQWCVLCFLFCFVSFTDQECCNRIWNEEFNWD